MTKLPDDLAGSLVYATDIVEVTRQLEEICETIAGAFNSSVDSRDETITLQTSPSLLSAQMRGIGLLMLLPTSDNNPALIALCCKPTAALAATINTLVSQASPDNRTYSVTWNANDALRVAVTGGPPHTVRTLWIGS